MRVGPADAHPAQGVRDDLSMTTKPERNADVTQGSAESPQQAPEPLRLAADATFAVVPTWVLRSTVSDRAVRLYAILRRYADATGYAWPSRATLSADLRCSTDSIDRALAELVRLRAVSIEHRHTAAGSPTSSLYRLRSTPGGNPVDEGEGVAAPVRLGGRRGAEGVAARVRHERKPVNEKTPNPTLPRGGCPAHLDKPAPRCRACGTTPRQLQAAARASRPEHCGTCDPDTRLVETPEGRARRCPTCHPLADAL